MTVLNVQTMLGDSYRPENKKKYIIEFSVIKITEQKNFIDRIGDTL